MNGSNNYPPGVTGREDYFWDDPEEEICVCGHSLDAHTAGLDRCLAEACVCSGFEPDDEEEDYG